MVSYNYQTIGYAGTDITFTAPTGGVAQDGITSSDPKGFFWVKNAVAGGSINVIVSTPGTTVGGLAIPDVTVAVPDGEQRLIGPIVADLADPNGGGGIVLSITGTMTGVTAAAVKVP